MHEDILERDPPHAEFKVTVLLTITPLHRLIVVFMLDVNH
jgi:hypothetical protein